MSTTLIIVMALLYAGPCTLVYLLGRRSGFEQGLKLGMKSQQSKHQANADWIFGVHD